MCTAAPWIQDKMCNWHSTCQIRRSIESSENWYLGSHLKRQLASSKCCCCILSDLPMCSAQLEGGKIEVDSRCNWHSGQGEPTLRPQIQERRRGEMPPGCIKIATVCNAPVCILCTVHQCASRAREYITWSTCRCHHPLHLLTKCYQLL